MPTIFSGVKPTGHLTLGNYLGAIRQSVEEDRYRAEALCCVVDLHALTRQHRSCAGAQTQRTSADRC